jgi:DNA-binding response OmpR family regulator
MTHLKSRILIVDDDVNICEILKLYIEKEGFETYSSHSGRGTVELFREITPNIVLLDIMIPDMDGYQVCREIRKISDVPVIMLTAKGETFDKVLGLELGADDYIVKPFEPKELIARIKAVLRRSEPKEIEVQQEVIYPNLVVNLSTYSAKINGKEIDFTRKELELLFFIASKPNRVFTREQLLEQIWGYDFIGDSRTVDVHINRLREKTESKSMKWQIKTVWGVGYKFEVK